MKFIDTFNVPESHGIFLNQNGDTVFQYLTIEGLPLTWHKPKLHDVGQYTKDYTVEKYIRTRLANPKEGQPKYISQKSQPIEFFYNGLWAFGFNPKEIETLFITEGEKKAYVACKYGVPTAGAQGIHNFVKFKKDSAGNKTGIAPSRVLSEIPTLFPNLKTVVLLHDSDCRSGSEKRRASFYSAVKNAFQACQKLIPHVEVIFAHGKDLERKAIDDMLEPLSEPQRHRLVQDLKELQDNKNFAFTAVNDDTLRNIKKYIFAGEPTNTGSIPLEFIVKCFYEHQAGDAALLSMACEGVFLHDATNNQWLRWKQGVWDDSPTNKADIIKIATELLPILYTKALGSLDEKAFQKRIASLKTYNYAANVVRLTEGYLGTTIDAFDSRPELVNFSNGYLNLNTGVFEEHAKDSRFKLKAGVEYKLTNEQPLFWLSFLEKAFLADAEVVRFVQKWVGLSLSGYTDFQAFIYAYGSGKNGKSTFFKAMEMLLGSYYKAINIEAILAKNSEAASYQIASLKGARLVVASEVPSGKRMNESQVKDLTGGDTIAARQIYGLPFSYKPTHKLALFGNHKLVITSQDNGIWRRVALVGFQHEFTDAIPMSDVLAKLQQELPAILNWAIQGYNLYKQEGMSLPESVKKETATYREESDVLREFLAESIEEDAKTKVKITEVFSKYIDFCKKRNEQPIFQNTRSFVSQLKERKYRVEVSTGGSNYLIGYKMATESAQQPLTLSEKMPF